MLDSLKKYFEERRAFNAVEKAFGEMLARRSGLEMTMEGIALYLLGAAALSAVEGSHSCLDLQEWCREEVASLKQLNAEKKEQTSIVSPEELEHWLDEWQSVCRELPEKASKAIIRCSYDESLNDVSVPLVIVESNETMVYLNRYFSYEKTIGEQIRERIKPMGQGESEQQSDVYVSDLQRQVHKSTKFFAKQALEEDNQQLAVLNSLLSPFSIVTGGPGRGKTTVLATILALALKMSLNKQNKRPLSYCGGALDPWWSSVLPESSKGLVVATNSTMEDSYNGSVLPENSKGLEEYEAKESWPEIALCAPTGKAAARMKQAIDKAVRNDLNKEVFDEQFLKSLSELRPWTVHRLLGLHQNSDYPMATAKNQLPYDFVAVDECSMMSLQLFSQLLAALKPGAKLLLLGDENQLASVDAGNVLAELCHSGLLASCTSPKVVNRLTVNYRSKDNKALCDYTDALVADDGKPDVDGLFNGGQGEKQGLFHAIEIIDNKSEREKQLKEVVASTLDGLKIKFGEDAQERRLVDCWKAPRSLEEAFAIIDSFKILSPVREGLYGIVSLNHIMRKYLDMKGEYDNGVPVLITENDSVTGLQNGDVGVCYKGQVWFKQAAGDDGTEKTQAYNPVQLPPHECAFAMTIHKSQGSDYENVLMVLPDKDSALLTRELVYTGITRTKTNFMLLAKRAILEKAQSRKTVRWSGLGKRLGL